MKVTNPDRNYLGTSLEGWPDSDELERILEKTERPRGRLSLDPGSRSYLGLLVESLSERFRR
jgi:hypothetical protein